MKGPPSEGSWHARSTIDCCERRHTPDSGMVHRGGHRGLRACGVLLLADFANAAAPSSTARISCLLQPFRGRADRTVLPDGGLRQQRRTAAGDELAVLDRDLLRDAGRYWR